MPFLLSGFLLLAASQWGPEGGPDIDYTSDSSFIVHWNGFIDHESGIRFYRVVLADHCLGHEDMSNSSKLESYMAVEIPYTESSVRLTANFTSKMYTSIVAINNAMDTSEPVCTDGVTRETSPPQITNVTLQNARTSVALICHYSQAWLMSSTMQKKQLHDIPACVSKCGNFTDKNEVAAFLPTATSNKTEKDVSEFLCQHYDVFSRDDNIIYIPSDQIGLTWDVNEGESQIHDYFIGFGYDILEYSSPGQMDYVPTHREQSFYKQHIGIASSRLFYIFVRVVSRTGESKISTIGPIVIDETPPLYRRTPDIEISGKNIMVSWENDTFYDMEQKEQIEQIYFQFGHDDQFVTPLMLWKLEISIPCLGHSGGCIKYPLESLQQQYTDFGLQFYASLYVYNKAGHFVEVQTDSVQIPSKYAPGNATVIDIDPKNKDFLTDIDVHFTVNTICAKWSGFWHHEKIKIEIGVGETSVLDDVVSFFEVENSNIQCINSSKLQPGVRYYFLLRATCSGGQTLSSSNGVSILTQSVFSSLVQVYVGEKCASQTSVQTWNFRIEHNNIILNPTVSVEIGKSYILFVPEMVKLTLTKDDGILEEKHGMFYGRYYSLIPFGERLEVSVQSTEISADPQTIDIFRCPSDSYFRFDVLFIKAFFNFPSKELYPVNYDAAFIEHGANETILEETVLYQRQLDKNMSLALKVNNIHAGGQYSVVVRPCVLDQCLKPVSSKSFSFVSKPPEGHINLAEIHSETGEACYDIRVEWYTFKSESPVLFYQWSMSEDGRSVQSMTLWETILTTNTSKYQITRCLDLPIDLHKTLFACVRAFTEEEQSVTVCKELQSKPFGVYTTNVVYDIDTTKSSWPDIKSVLTSSNPGSKYKLLHDSELDFGTRSSGVTGIILYGTERQTNWFLMTKNQIPVYCITDQDCVESGISDTGFLAFKTRQLQESRRYYICANSNETHIERETFTEILSELTSCSDGFVIDNTPPSGGAIHVTSKGRYLNDVSNIRVTWDEFKDNINALQFGYISAIKWYSIAVGSIPGGEDIAEFSEHGLSTVAVIDLKRTKDGAAVYISIKATDHAGFSNVVTSEELIVDSSPPRTGYIMLNQNYGNGNLFVNSKVISVRVLGFHDTESGIDKYEVSVGTWHTLDDIYPVSEFTEDTYTLRMSTNMLLDGHTYVLTFKAFNRAGLSSNPLRKSFIFDPSAPTGGHVMDGEFASKGEVDYQEDVHHIKAHWKGFNDVHSGIGYYRVGLGATQYEDDIESMLDVGLNTDMSMSIQFDKHAPIFRIYAEITWNGSLTPGQRYYTVVEGCNKAGLCTTRTSDGIILDNSPPIHGLVRVGSASLHQKYISKRSSVHLHWYGFEDPQSDIQRFEACIGTRPESCDVVPVFDCNLQTSILKTGIDLPKNRNLYANVHAYNKVRMSVLQSSDAFRIDDSQPINMIQPHFILDYGFVPGFSVQWERSKLRVSWEFTGPDSPITSHILTLKTHHEGHTPVENIHLGSETNLTIVLDAKSWLNSWDKYFVVVTCCNAAGLCTSAESTNLLIDSSPPHLGGFKNPMTWTIFTNVEGKVKSNLSLTWYGFHDQESDIDKYFITVSRSYSGAELSDGEIIIKANSSTKTQTSRISLTDRISRDDLLVLSVWAQNRAGMNSSIGRVSVNVLSTSSSSQTLQEGVLELEQHSCDIHYCNNDCTCAVIGKPCTSFESRYNCTILNANEALDAALPFVQVYGGLQMFPQTITASSACMSGHWVLSNHSRSVSRFEWSIGLINQPIGEGIFDLRKDIPWKDVGKRNEMVHCLSTNESLIHSEQYVIYVKAWYAHNLSAIFKSDPVIIDQTPPSVRRGRSVKDSDISCTADFDFIDWMDTITACWDKVFSEQNSAITHYTIGLGTSQKADDVFHQMNVSLSTNITLNNLTLSHGTRYYFSVTAYNNIGLYTTTSSDGFVIDMEKPISGVVFNTARHMNAAFQPDNNSLTLSWHGFIDHYTGIKSYYAAIIEESELNMTFPMFTYTGLQNTFKFNKLNLKHGKRYVGLMKAVDAAGHESEVSVSPWATIDTSPPETITCNKYQEMFTENAKCSNDNSFEISRQVNLLQNSFYMVQGSVIAADIGASAELNINRFVVHVPFVTGHGGFGTFHYTFVQYDSTKSDITIKGPCNGNTTVILTLARCSEMEHNTDASITLQQIEPSRILIKVNVFDHESHIRKMFIGLGTTYGGYQIKPLSQVHDGGQSVETVDVPHGSEIFATVIAENLAGLRSVFHSIPIIMDKTPPRFADIPAVTMTKDPNTTYSFEATWNVKDDESGIKQCYCTLEKQFDPADSKDFSSTQPGRCQKDNVKLNHGDTVYVSVLCINKIEMGAHTSSDTVTISEEPPSVRVVQVMVVPRNAYRAESLQLEGQLAVQSNQTCVQIQWSGFFDVFGIEYFEYRLTRGQEVVTDWANAGRQTMTTIRGVHLQSDSVYTAEVRAWNIGRHVSDVVMTDVLILGSGPSLSGNPMYIEKSGQQMHMDWSGVFGINKLVPVRYTIIIGSKYGYNDVIEHTTTDTTYITNIPESTMMTPTISELFIDLSCFYVTGLYNNYRTTYKL